MGDAGAAMTVMRAVFWTGAIYVVVGAHIYLRYIRVISFQLY